ncbi:Molybdenum ABC transporter ATP-binding protein ModC [hydrothermal vent metagenome]|uniref:Molybdenum ABC transporter ATP-binding protein ModC n=1 Tax=hydrothermal vent metagenome TaxID=652676 RepID=A0A3B1AA87_9ZZZZ
MIVAKFNINRGDFIMNADLSIPASGITALYGPSGCGKTTLMRAMAGLDHHKNGFMQVGNMKWQSTGQFIATHRRSLAYVFQEASLFAHLNVRANLEYGYKRIPASERKIKLDKAIELLGIKHLLDRKPVNLSGGERQRIAIARALVVSPKLLLMDEPLAALDQKSKQEILVYLESVHTELDIPIIYISHSSDEVARLADHLVLLEEGKVTASGPIGDMLTRLDLPLAQGTDAETLIEAKVVGHDGEFNLTYLELAGSRFTVTRHDLAIGKMARLRVLACDVSITLQHQADTSILNIFPAVVDEIKNEGTAQVIIRLLVGGVPMLSRITRKSASILDLKPGKQVYAQAKSVALLA